jgi:predicted ribonuclease YlaK
MSLLAVPIIALVALVLSILCLVIIFVLITRYKAKLAVYESQSQTHELLVNSVQLANDNLNLALRELSIQQEESLTENTLVSKQLEHRIKALQAQFNSQQDLISQLQTDQGDDKFYSRAIKLAKIGASIEEIVAECELPHAEVEMLISVYQNKTQR